MWIGASMLTPKNAQGAAERADRLGGGDRRCQGEHRRPARGARHGHRPVGGRALLGRVCAQARPPRPALRGTRRMTFREMFSSRQVSLMAFFWTKYARRILAIASTTSIPISAPDGSRSPESGGLIPCRLSRQRADGALLPYAQGRARPPPRLRHQGRRAPRSLRLYRGLVQFTPPALRHRLQIPGRHGTHGGPTCPSIQGRITLDLALLLGRLRLGPPREHPGHSCDGLSLPRVDHRLVNAVLDHQLGDRRLAPKGLERHLRLRLGAMLLRLPATLSVLVLVAGKPSAVSGFQGPPLPRPGP